MGALQELQEHVRDQVNAIPIVGNSCFVHRHGDLASECEGRAKKFSGKAVCIKLLGFELTARDGITYNAKLAAQVWTVTTYEHGNEHVPTATDIPDQYIFPGVPYSYNAGAHFSDEGDAVYYDDLVEEITKAIHRTKYPPEDKQCSNRLQVTSAKLKPIQDERLKAFTVFEILITTPFSLAITHK